MLLLEHTCDIQRQQAVGTNGRMSLSTLSTAVSCLFLPMSSMAAVQNSYSVSKAYDVFFNAGQDVAVGDKLVRSGKKYVVRGVSRYETAAGAHVQVAAEQEGTT